MIDYVKINKFTLTDFNTKKMEKQMEKQINKKVTVTRRNARIFDLMGLSVNITLENVTYNPPKENKNKKGDDEQEEEKRENFSPYDFVKIFMGEYLRYIRYYPKTNSLYIYSHKKGIYKEYSGNEFRSLIGELITKSPLEYKVNTLYYRDQVMEFIKIAECTYYETPKYNWDCVVFKNGVMDMKTKIFTPWTPDLFLTSCVDYNYEPEMTCPFFLNFLNDFCGGHQDRVNFLRSWMHSLLTVDKSAQVFLYVYGLPGSGKSMLSNYIQAILGKDKVVNTSLKSLNTDRFELHNLRGKPLILINDAERYEADAPILKQITGSDTISSSCKYVQGSFPMDQVGLVMIISNHPLVSKDNADPLSRRYASIKSCKPEGGYTSIPLIYQVGDTFVLLHDELSGIFNWIIEWDSKKSLQYLSDIPTNVPSLASYYQTALANINPLCAWVQECLQPGNVSDYAYVGLVGDDETTLYGHYKNWSKKEGIRAKSPRRWADDLLNHLQNLKDYKNVTDKRMKRGNVFTNIKLKPDDYKEEVELRCTSVNSNPNQSTPPEHENLTTCEKDQIFLDTVKPYISSLSYKDNPLYELSKIQMTSKDLEVIFELATRDRTHMNDTFLNLIKKRLVTDSEKIKKYGLLVQTWDLMGTSPRWQPLVPTPGNSVTNRKNHVKYYGYYLFKKELDNHFNCSSSLIIDIDIVSCYLNILIGTFRHETKTFSRMFSSGIWNEMQAHFQKQGYGGIYRKKWAKIALYSTFFGGGDRAMRQGILESERSNMGLTPADFNNWQGYRPMIANIDQLVKLVKVSDLILNLKNAINLIKKNHTKYDKQKGGYYTAFKSICNREYIGVSDDFSKNLSNMLMETEIIILSQSMIEFKNKYPSTLLLGHFHDGVCIYIPNPIMDKEGYIEDLNKIMRDVSARYKIEPPLSTETKDLTIYGL